MKTRINIRSVFEKGGMCFYVTPKNASVKEYFMFLHGGGFVSQMSRNEWRFVLDTVESTGYGAVVPVYPIAPDIRRRRLLICWREPMRNSVRRKMRTG